MDRGHLERIQRAAEGRSLVDALTDLPPTDLQSLMLEVYQRRAQAITPARLMDRYANDRFVQLAAADPRDMVDFDRIAFQLACDLRTTPVRFTPIELSPLAPLGTVSALTNINQNNVISTARNSEIVSDCTNAMALESTRLRSKQDRVDLCCSHRLVRTQPFSGPLSFAHFRVFAMCSAGRDEGGYEFERKALADHLATYVSILDTMRGYGFGVKSIRLTLTDFSGKCGEVISCVNGQVSEGFASPIEITEEKERTHAKNYYASIAFAIYAIDDKDNEYNIGDGGFTDWTQKLLNNNKERYLIGALGSERLCTLFGTHRTS